MPAYYNEIDPHAAQWLRNLSAGAREELEAALRADIHASEASWQTIKALFERLDRRGAIITSLTQERDAARDCATEIAGELYEARQERDEVRRSGSR